MQAEENSRKRRKKSFSWTECVLNAEKLEELANTKVEDRHELVPDYEDIFYDTAKRLLSETILTINDQPHVLAEIEFYYKGKNHNDVFTHGDPLQATFGHWYFHKTGSGYKGGTYKGLDITFGGQGGAYGGILIRSIATCSEPRKVIEGPCKVVDHILSTCDESSIASFVESCFPDSPDSPPIADVSSKLYISSSKSDGSEEEEKEKDKEIEKEKEEKEKEVYRSARFGLSLRQTREDNARFIMRPYRFVSIPSLLKKGKPHLIVCIHHVDGKTAAEISKITKTNQKTVDRYLDFFQTGKEKKPDKWIEERKTLNTQAVCELYGALVGSDLL